MQTLWPDIADLPPATTPHQRSQATIATSRPVGILGGSPGTGKTWLAAQIIKLCVQHHGQASVAVCGPTGKSAVRITEAMLGHGLDGIQATTTHRLLGTSRNGHDQKGWGFIHNKMNPLPHRFIFADEGSMYGTTLSASLLEACLPGTHILWAGDYAQLPPVEHGAPLRDMIAAGMPYGELTEIHRNAGDIVTACRDLKDGRPFRPSRLINLAEGRNLRHIEAQRPSQALGELAELVRNIPTGIDPMWDVQVLCATNKSSDVSRKNLNTGLQRLLNPGGEQIEGSRFRLGDKVICLTNGMLPLVECPDCHSGPEHCDWNGKWFTCLNLGCGREWKVSEAVNDFVANGEIGRVAMLDKRFMHVSFDSPRRTIRVAGEWLSEFDLAYGITVHKSQGSQWPIVIIMADDSFGADMVTSYEWYRTAISRAEKLCITIGRKSAIDRQCKKSALRDRKTFLREMLKGLAA